MGSKTGKEIFGIVAALPVVLIHGYAEDSSVWDSWEGWLNASGIPNHTITFDDECGSVVEHATELNRILNGSEQVNIVAHSKGGLDARWYISHFDDNVENLIMIATPNEGTPAAYIDLTTCAFQGSAGREDMLPNSVTIADQKDTDYYTIAGNYPVPCYIVIERPTCYVIDNDGFVTVESAKSHYESLGIFYYNHSALLTQKDIYQKVLPIIGGGK